ncbi:hypothetical protein FS842_007680 [Serendipita sp. 407]|nr:hypothetical protein FS842_007680 [Serendipita sp. 407]
MIRPSNCAPARPERLFINTNVSEFNSGMEGDEWDQEDSSESDDDYFDSEHGATYTSYSDIDDVTVSPLKLGELLVDIIFARGSQDSPHSTSEETVTPSEQETIRTQRDSLAVVTSATQTDYRTSLSPHIRALSLSRQLSPFSGRPETEWDESNNKVHTPVWYRSILEGYLYNSPAGERTRTSIEVLSSGLRHDESNRRCELGTAKAERAMGGVDGNARGGCIIQEGRKLSVTVQKASTLRVTEVLKDRARDDHDRYYAVNSPDQGFELRIPG